MIAWRVASLVPRLAPGSTFADRFKILDYVGQGSVGHVYRVEPLAGGEAIALKLMKIDDAPDGRALRRFEREVESGKRVQSPYVAATLDSGKLGERLAWLTMEFAPGVTLDELVRARGALPRAHSRRLLSQAFAALATAHAAGIVHRDLKPENLKVSGEGDGLRLKVLDFGIAKDFDGSLSHTTPGIGTPLWAAPELSGAEPRARPSADVWSLGLLTFFVLTGHLYWRHSAERASLADLALEIVRSEIEPPSLRARELGLATELPRGFDDWFGRAVHRDPALRFGDAAAAWAALEPLLSPEPATLGPSTADRPTPVVRPGPLLAAVLLSCVAAGLAIYWLLRSMRI